MSEFDPRRGPVRFAPVLAVMVLTVSAGALMAGTRAEAVPASKAKASAEAAKASKTKADAKTSKGKASAEKPDAVKVAAKTDAKDDATAKPTKAAAKPAAGPAYGKPQLIKVKLRKGETLEAAVRRAEASAEEAKAVSKLVETQLGAAPKAGQLFQVEVAPREGRVGSGRVHRFSLKSGVESENLTVLRGESGKLAVEKPQDAAKLAKAEPKGKDASSKSAASKSAASKSAKPADADQSEADGGVERVKLVSGEVRGSLYGSARKAGVGGGQIGEIVKVFAAKLDFERDLKAGDPFKVVYDDGGKLLFAQIKGVRFHRFARKGGETLWLDEDGRSLKGGLLRTPVDGARMSSSFGMRKHPIFGYHRMHQGVDFAAPAGTPILAAGDGTVVEIRRWGGYGNWLRIKHAGGYESGYAHLSKYAKGLSVGDKVKQGELVAYVGSTGASTGPHLHHEIWLNGKRVDPKGAKIPAAQILEGKELIAFKAQRKRVDAVLKGDTALAGKKGKTKVAALRPKQDAE